MKKYNQLYNRVFNALHMRDNFVIASELHHDQVVDRVAETLKTYHKTHGMIDMREMAEAIIEDMLVMP